jgi:hypothetical protein
MWFQIRKNSLQQKVAIFSFPAEGGQEHGVPGLQAGKGGAGSPQVRAHPPAQQGDSSHRRWPQLYQRLAIQTCFVGGGGGGSVLDSDPVGSTTFWPCRMIRSYRCKILCS